MELEHYTYERLNEMIKRERDVVARLLHKLEKVKYKVFAIAYRKPDGTEEDTLIRACAGISHALLFMFEYQKERLRREQ